MTPKIIPPLYLMFSSIALIADAQPPDLPMQKTAVGALIGISTVLVTALVWVVKRQFEVNRELATDFKKIMKENQEERERMLELWARTKEGADKR